MLWGRRRRASAVVLLVLVALATKGGSRILLGLLLLPQVSDGAPPEAIVVLPGDAPGLVNPGGAEPSLFTLDRLRTAAALHRRTGLPLLVSEGEPAGGMAASLRDDFQVPVRWHQPAAATVWERAEGSAATLRAAGISRAWIVADAWDERLDLAVFRRAGIDAVPAPVRRPDPLVFDWTTLPPATPAWLDSALALGQWAGLACDAVPLCLSSVSPGVASTPGR